MNRSLECFSDHWQEVSIRAEYSQRAACHWKHFPSSHRRTLLPPKRTLLPTPRSSAVSHVSKICLSRYHFSFLQPDAFVQSRNSPPQRAWSMSSIFLSCIPKMQPLLRVDRHNVAIAIRTTCRTHSRQANDTLHFQ